MASDSFVDNSLLCGVTQDFEEEQPLSESCKPNS
jgi:hypothetical protein